MITPRRAKNLAKSGTGSPRRASTIFRHARPQTLRAQYRYSAGARRRPPQVAGKGQRAIDEPFRQLSGFPLRKVGNTARARHGVRTLAIGHGVQYRRDSPDGEPDFGPVQAPPARSG
jgi:hypothetical protein